MVWVDFLHLLCRETFACIYKFGVFQRSGWTWLGDGESCHDIMNALETLTRDWTNCVLIDLWVGPEGIVWLHEFAFTVVALGLRMTQEVLTGLRYPLVENVLFVLLNRLILVSLAFCLARVWASRCDGSVLVLFVAGAERNNSVSLRQTLANYFASANWKWRHVYPFALLKLFSVS